MNRKLLSLFTITAFVSWGSQAARADYEVQVGYADTVRSSPFFPSPWQGGAGVDTFAGATDSDGSIDAGAIRIINNGSSPITFNGMTVDSFGDGSSFNLWGLFAGDTIQPGHSMILTQTGTSFENFDTSDHQGGNSAADAVPRVLLTIDGVPQTFLDTAQVLNTEGSDHLAQAGENESHAWRDIGTFGGQAGDVPDVGSTLSLLGIALSGVAYLRRRLA